MEHSASEVLDFCPRATLPLAFSHIAMNGPTINATTMKNTPLAPCDTPYPNMAATVKRLRTNTLPPKPLEP